MGLNENDIRRIAWTAAQTFIAAFAVTASGWSTVPNYDTGKAAVISAGVAAIAAALSAAKNLVLSEGSTLK